MTPSYDRFSWFWLQLCLNFTISKYRPVARYIDVSNHTHTHTLTHAHTCVHSHAHISFTPWEREHTVGKFSTASYSLSHSYICHHDDKADNIATLYIFNQYNRIAVMNYGRMFLSIHLAIKCKKFILCLVLFRFVQAKMKKKKIKIIIIIYDKNIRRKDYRSTRRKQRKWIFNFLVKCDGDKK